MHWNILLIVTAVVVVLVWQETCGVWVGGTRCRFMRGGSGQLHSGSSCFVRVTVTVTVVVVNWMVLLLLLMLMVSHNWLVRDHWCNDSLVVLLHAAMVVVRFLSSSRGSSIDWIWIILWSLRFLFFFTIYSAHTTLLLLLYFARSWQSPSQGLASSSVYNKNRNGKMLIVQPHHHGRQGAIEQLGHTGHSGTARWYTDKTD